MSPRVSLPVDLSIVEDDIANRFSDLLILKSADGFYGADANIAEKIAFSDILKSGETRLLRGRSIEAKDVLFIGVGVLTEFRYGEIRSFARKALISAQISAPAARKITTTIHGPGYGLDERESLLALVAGFVDAIRAGEMPHGLVAIEVVERDPKRTSRLKKYLAEVYGKAVRSTGSSVGMFRLQGKGVSTVDLESFGDGSEAKTKLFVAMPFKTDFTDEYEIAISEACDKSGIICERIDRQSYVGDIFDSIKKRISSYDGLIALLNESNPNVFLEIGFAWAKNKPTILIMREGGALPFDIRGQKCIMYTSIHGLRQTLQHELAELKKAGVFSHQ